MTYDPHHWNRERFNSIRYYHGCLTSAQVKEKVVLYRRLIVQRDEIQAEHDAEIEVLDDLLRQKKDIVAARSIVRLSQESKKELEAMFELVEAELLRQKQKVQVLQNNWLAVMEALAPIYWHWKMDPNRFSSTLRNLKEEEWQQEHGDGDLS